VVTGVQTCALPIYRRCVARSPCRPANARARRAPRHRVLRRDDPQQEHPHGLTGPRPLLCLRRAAQIGELADIEAIHVAAHIEALQATAAKLPLAAIRMLFDWLVVRSWPTAERKQEE
jgi:hypothetical protein